MKKRCANGHLNDASNIRCQECGASLKCAQEVPDDFEELAPNVDYPESPAGADMTGIPSQPPGPVGSTTTGMAGNGNPQAVTGESYLCIYPDPDPATGMCKSCDKPVASHPVAEVPLGEVPTNAPKTPPPLFLVLPDGYRVPIMEGVAIGRGAQYASVEMATRLSLYKGVSRLHAWMGQEGDALLLLDLGSRNGTWVNAMHLKPFSVTRLMLNTMPVKVRLGANLTLSLVAGDTA